MQVPWHHTEGNILSFGICCWILRHSDLFIQVKIIQSKLAEFLMYDFAACVCPCCCWMFEPVLHFRHWLECAVLAFEILHTIWVFASWSCIDVDESWMNLTLFASFCCCHDQSIIDLESCWIRVDYDFGVHFKSDIATFSMELWSKTSDMVGTFLSCFWCGHIQDKWLLKNPNNFGRVLSFCKTSWFWCVVLRHQMHYYLWA